MDKRIEGQVEVLRKLSGRYEYHKENRKRAKERLKRFGGEVRTVKDAKQFLKEKEEDLDAVNKRISEEVRKIKKIMRRFDE